MGVGPVLLGQWTRLRMRQGGEPRPEYLRMGLLGTGCLLVSYLVWALMVFGPGTIVIHQDSNFLELCGFAVGVVGWNTLAPRSCVALVVGQSLFAVWMYGVAVPTGIRRDMSTYRWLGRGQPRSSWRFGALYYMWVSRTVQIDAPHDRLPLDSETASPR